MTLEICAALLIMLGAVGILLVPLLFGSKIGLLRDDINELVRGRAEVTQQLQLAVGQHDKAMYSNHHKEILRAQNANDAARRRQEESLNSLKKATQFMVTIARYCDKISITEEKQKRDRVAGSKAYEEIWPIYESYFKLVSQSLNRNN